MKKTTTTEQKIRLPVELLDALKKYALEIGVIRGKQTTWADILRDVAANVVTKCPPEKFVKWIDGRLGPDGRPSEAIIRLSEETLNKLTKLALDVGVHRNRKTHWGDLGKLALKLILDLDAKDIAVILDGRPAPDARPGKK